MTAFARRFSLIALILVAFGALWTFGKAWLAAHPEHDPGAPFVLNQRDGWATGRKWAKLRADSIECRGVLTRSNVSLTALEPVGEGSVAVPIAYNWTAAR